MHLPNTAAHSEHSLPWRWHWIFAVSIVLVIISGLLAFREYVRFSQASSAVDHAYEVLSTVDELVVRLLDTENSTRGYLLTKAPALLAPHRESAPLVTALTQRLSALVADNPDQAHRAERIAALSQAEIEALNTAVADFEQGQARQAIARLSSGDGQRYMGAIRVLAAAMKTAERSLLSDRENQALLARRASVVFALASLLVAVSLGFVAISVDRGFARRRMAFDHEMAARLSAERSMQSAARELYRSERLNRSILDSSADCIQLLEPDGRLLLINEPGLRLLAIDDFEPFRRLPWPDLWGESAGVARDALATATAKGTARFRAFCPTTRGAPKWWDVIVTPIRDADGGVARLMCIARDVTEHTHAEEERNHLLASERAARGEAERAVHLKDQFLATLSHELRTPLNAIVGWLGVLNNDRSPATLQKALAVIDRNARRQSQMVDDLLDVSRIVSGKLGLDVQRIDMASVVDEAVTAAQPAADTKGIQLVADAHGPTIVHGDPVRLQQVLWNLIGNAVKFTGPGGRVEVIVRAGRSHVQVHVRDTGQGIAPDLLPHLFQRFRQGDSSSSRAHGGLGLGLAIVKAVVEMHGGHVTVSSEGTGRGTVFTIGLPLAPDAEGEGGSPLEGRAAGRALLAGIVSMVVEDEPDEREVIQRLLEDAGATVRAFPGADAALHAVQEGLVPDVFLSDVSMPGCDGYEFMRRIRQMEGRVARVPAAAITALACVDDRRRASLAGYQTQLPKPLDAGELVATVASLVGRTGRRNT